MFSGGLRKALGRLLPDSAFWRLVMATAVLSVLTAVGAMVVSKVIGRQLVHSISEDSAYTVLRNTVDLIGRTSIQLAEDRSKALEASKKSLVDALDFSTGFIETYATENGLDADSRSRSFQRLGALSGRMEPAIAVQDGSGGLVVEGNGIFKGSSRSEVMRELAASARKSPGESVFHLDVPPGGEGIVLMAARHESRWELTFLAAAPFGGETSALQEKRRLTLNEMRARINEIVVAESGYIYVFDDNCDMVVHPTLVGEDFSGLQVPGEERSMCRALRETAEKPWGENTFRYKWDRPEDSGNYIYDKVTWGTVEPTTGWVVGVSVYLNELEAPLPGFVARIFLPALGSILLLGLALALILRSQLRPVNALSRVCQRVSHGDLEASAPTDVSGEIGQLCWHFNSMIKRIRGLRQRDERRRRELEDLNMNLERKVLLRTRALERKAHKLEEANNRLKELDELKTSFVSSVSHELRTPLTSILGFAKMIHRDYDRLRECCDMEAQAGEKRPRRILANLGIIVQEGERLSRLINDFLDLAKIEAGRLDWHDSLLDFQEVVMDCLDSMQSQIRCSNGVLVRHDIAPDMPPLYADRDRLTQVVLNLMSNALKFTAEGEVLLHACHSGGILQCRVSDTGCGIQRSELWKVFDKFHQITDHDTRREKPQGTGLGLAICRNIVEHYGGIIWAESSPGQGAEIVFEIPLRRDLDDLVPEETSVEPHRSRLPRNGAEPPLVLVVDDDQHVQSLLLHLFEDAGFRVTTASDGETALKRVQAMPPDLITMDLLMPGMLGSEAIDRLRADPRFRDTPVILVSALADTHADNHTESDAVLSKPIDEDLLLATAQALLLGDETPLPRLDFLQQQEEWRAGTPYICDELGNCDFCPLSEIGARVESGFTGMVCVPRDIENAPEVKALAMATGIQVVVL